MVAETRHEQKKLSETSLRLWLIIGHAECLDHVREMPIERNSCFPASPPHTLAEGTIKPPKRGTSKPRNSLAVMFVPEKRFREFSPHFWTP